MKDILIAHKEAIGERVRIKDTRSLFFSAKGTIVGEKRWGAGALFVIELDQAGHTQSWVHCQGTRIVFDEFGLERINEG